MESSKSKFKLALGWGVHLYTGLGIVCAAGMAMCIVRGTPFDFVMSFWLIGVALFIDSTDGTFARALEIKKLIPNFDGRRLDDIIDYQTYTSLPLLLIWRAGILPAGTEWCLVVAALSSLYGFCQVKAKTDDGYFLGFPSYWNLVAFYLYVLPFSGYVAMGTILFLSALTFVPTRYLYPSQGGKLNMFTNILGLIWSVMFVYLVATMKWNERPGAESFYLAAASLFFPVYYLVASWVIEFRIAFKKRTRFKIKSGFQAAVFDMDGTIADTEHLHLIAYQQVLKQFDTEMGEEEYDQFTGKTDAEICKYLIDKHGLASSVSELLASKDALFLEIVKGKLKPLPGVVRTFKMLHKRNIKIAVASSSTLAVINAVIDALELRKFISVIASGEEVENSKPAPDVFLLAAKRLNIEPALCLAFEDSQNGTLAASRAGMYTVAIPCASTKHQNFDAANLKVESMDNVDVGALKVDRQSARTR